MAGTKWQVGFRLATVGYGRQDGVWFAEVEFGKARRGMVRQAWSGVDWRAEAGHGKVRHALAGMVGFGWSGKGLTGQSWEWQVWNQKKGVTKWFMKKSIRGDMEKACLHR